MTRGEVLSYAYALKLNYTVDLNKMPDFAQTVIELLSFESKVDELEKASGKTFNEMLAMYASEDDQPPFECNVCPLRLKGICKPMHPGESCFELWLNYLEGK